MGRNALTRPKSTNIASQPSDGVERGIVTAQPPSSTGGVAGPPQVAPSPSAVRRQSKPAGQDPPPTQVAVQRSVMHAPTAQSVSVAQASP